MNNKIPERRQYVRFELPGVFLSYRKRSFLSFKKEPAETYCPVQNISQGGAKILCREPAKPGAKIALKIIFPQDDLTLEVKGRVVWIYPLQARDFNFSAGIQFEKPCQAIAEIQDRGLPSAGR
jgi:Tfp pilus assembly protein PilZ